MKHLLLLIFFNLLLFSNEYNLTQQEQEYLKNKKEFIIHFDKNNYPYQFYKDNKPSGYLYDVEKLLSKKLGVSFSYIYNSWSENFDLLKQNKLDIIFGVTYTKDRLKELNFSSIPIFSEHKSIFSLNNYKSLEELKNKKVLTPKNAYWNEIIKKQYPQINLVEINSNNNLVSMLINKEADAVLDEYIHVEELIKELSLNISLYNNIYFLDNLTPKVHIATSKSNTIIMNIIDKVLSQEELNAMQEKWGLIPKKKNKIDINLSDEELTYLRNNTFNIYMDEWAPFRIYDKDKKIFTGLSIDLLNLISGMIPLKTKISYVDTYTSRLKAIEDDEKSLNIWTTNLGQPSNTLTTKPFISYPVALITLLEENFITDFNDLNGKIIAVGKNYSAYHLLKEYYPDINFKFTNNTLEAIDLVNKGVAFGAIDMSININYIISNHLIKNMKISGISKEKINIRMSTHKENEKLITILNKVINQIPNEKIIEIQNRWKPIVPQIISYAWLWYIVGILALIIILIQYRNNKILDKKNKLERKLSNSLLQAQNISKLGSWEYNVQTNKHIWSNMIFEIFNRDISLGEADVKEVSKYYGKKSWEKLLNAVNICIQKGEPYELLVEVITSNGEQKWAIARGARISDNPVILAGTLQDVTEKILADKENEIQQALMMKQSRHAQMGEMISMIAHQWRQPLNALGIWQQNLLDILMKDNYEHPKLGMIKTEMEKLILHLDQTIKDFRDFFKQDKESKVFKVRDSIKKTIGLINDKINASNININIDVDENIKVKCYENELSQVFMVIINNAQEQLLKENNYSNRNISFSANQDEYNTTITICDNGGGIPSDIIDKIFDPYFSTKSLNGTGIGLYLVKTIIEKSMHGKITASNTQTGACFIIEIPNEVQIGGGDFQ